MIFRVGATMEIFLNEDSMYINKSKVVMGELYFMIRKCHNQIVTQTSIEQKSTDSFVPEEIQFFPALCWSDYISTILAWWGREVIAAIDSKSNIILQFMDGSYRIKLTRMDDYEYRAEYFDGEVVVISENVSKKELVIEFLKLYRRFILVCDKNGFELENRWLFERSICIFENYIAKCQYSNKLSF